MANEHTNGLEMRWLPVTDATGREHMECVWIRPDAIVAPAHAA